MTQHSRDEVGMDGSRVLRAALGRLGNLQALMLCGQAYPKDTERIRQANARLVDCMIQLARTCTGGHGINRGQLTYTEREHGDAVMRFKEALDPRGLQRPRKGHARTCPEPTCRQRAHRPSKSRSGATGPHQGRRIRRGRSRCPIRTQKDIAT